LRKLSILCLSDRLHGLGRYSTSHPLLEDVFARLLPLRGHRVIWALHAAERTTGGPGGKWHESELWLLPSAGRSRLARPLNALWRKLFLTPCLGRLVREYGVDVIHVRNDWISASAAARVQRRTGVPFVYQWSFPHPRVHEARAADGLTRWPAIAKARARLEHGLYLEAVRAASHVLPISDWMLEELAAQGVQRERMTPLPLGCDPSIQPEERLVRALRDQYARDGAALVLYVGDMGRLRRLEFLLDVLQRLQHRIRHVRLVMVGGGDAAADVTRLQSIAAGLGVGGCVDFPGYRPRAEIPAWLAMADVVVSPIRPIPLYNVSSPTKLLEAMGAGRPVVANDTPEQLKILTESRGGIVVPYDVEAFASAVAWMVEHPVEAAAMGRAGRAFVAQHRSLSSLADRLERAYDAALGEAETRGACRTARAHVRGHAG
jgi:glycosyltransferase involved in cell wall biosynthesis